MKNNLLFPSIGGVVVLLLAVIFWPAGGDVNNQAEKVTTSITILSPDQFDKKLKNYKGKPVMLFIYASWCPHCRAVWEKIDEMFYEGAFQHVEPFFVSLDKDKEELGKYLITYGYFQHFHPYSYSPQRQAALVESMKERDSVFEGGIPHFSFINKRGKIVAEAAGNVDKSVLEEKLSLIE